MSDLNSEQVLAPIIGSILIGFPVLWTMLLSLISKFGGWSELAQHYAYDGPPPASVKRFQSMSMGRGKTVLSNANYGNAVTIGIDDEFLYLSVFALFFIGHKPLRIPLSDISMVDKTKFTVALKIIHFAKAPKININMRKALVDNLTQLQAG